MLQTIQMDTFIHFVRTAVLGALFLFLGLAGEDKKALTYNKESIKNI
jgi:hypothetical protein